jgi:hypothetical protein
MKKPQLILAAALTTAIAAAAPAAAAPNWAPASSASVHPGVENVYDSGEWNSNIY